MKIGIVGSGVVGQSLAQGFIKYGNEVIIGTREPKKLADWKEKAGPKSKVGSFSDAAAFGEMVVLAVKGAAAKEALKIAGAEYLKGKVVIDVTNPIADATPEQGVLKFFSSLDRSLMEDLQDSYPEAKFVKAFNSIGSAFMVNPDFGQTPTMFICGNDTGAKKAVSRIVAQFGFEVEDMGEAPSARAIEPLCMLWCIPGLRNNEWAHAFKLLKKK